MKRVIFIKTIEKEIAEGEAILKDIGLIEPLPNQGELLGSMDRIAGMVKYNTKELEKLTTQLYLWEKRVKEVLNSYLVANRADVVDEFVISEVEGWMDFKHRCDVSISKNLNVLRSIIDRLDYIDGGEDWGETQEEK